MVSRAVDGTGSRGQRGRKHNDNVKKLIWAKVATRRDDEEGKEGGAAGEGEYESPEGPLATTFGTAQRRRPTASVAMPRPATTPGATDAQPPWDPGTSARTALSANAAVFRPSQFSVAAAEFIPGQQQPTDVSTWGWQQGVGDDSWYGAAAAADGFGGYAASSYYAGGDYDPAMCSVPSEGDLASMHFGVSNELASGSGPQIGASRTVCLFNDDAYSTDSSSPRSTAGAATVQPASSESLALAAGTAATAGTSSGAPPADVIPTSSAPAEEELMQPPQGEGRCPPPPLPAISPSDGGPLAATTVVPPLPPVDSSVSESLGAVAAETTASPLSGAQPCPLAGTVAPATPSSPVSSAQGMSSAAAAQALPSVSPPRSPDGAAQHYQEWAAPPPLSTPPCSPSGQTCPRARGPEESPALSFCSEFAVGSEMSPASPRFATPASSTQGAPSASSSRRLQLRSRGSGGLETDSEHSLLGTSESEECSDDERCPLASADKGGGALGADGPGTVSVIREMNERTLKQWLQRFANDGDADVLGYQLRAWIDNCAGTPASVATWLLRRGIDDCMCAVPVADALERLLFSGQVSTDVVEPILLEFSGEYLEDLILDNPKVTEFITAVRAVCAKAATGAAAERPSEAAAAPPGDGLARTGSSPGAVYSRRFLLEARAGCAGGSPRWRTEAASSLFGLPPSWQQRMSGDAAAVRSCEWRESQSEVDPRGRRGGKGMGGHQRDAAERDAPRRDGPGTQSLPVAETSWLAQVRRLKGEQTKTDAATAADEQFVREMRLTLNKLTVERFDSLSDHIIGLISKSTRPHHGIPVMMQMVFQKATTQHHFIDMYVNLCVKVNHYLTANTDTVEQEAKSNFKRILLNQCQNSFEQYLEPPEGFDGLAGDELYEAQVKYKTRMLGNIKLVGELIRHGMLAPKIALSVAAELLRDDPIVRDERLETLAVFLESVGSSLDIPTWPHFQEFDSIFNNVSGLVVHKAISSRIRCLLRDVLDLRRNHWRSHKVRAFDSDAPATIAQVHHKASQDQNAPSLPARRARRSARALAQDRPSQRSRRRSGGGGTSAGSTGGTSGAGSGAEARGGGGGCRGAASAEARRRLTPATPGTSPVMTPSGPPNMRELPHSAPEEGAEPPQPPPAAASAAAAATEQIAVGFHKELALTLQELGNSIDVAVAVERLHGCGPLPAERHLQEAADLLARMVDEPRSRRRALFPLVPALFGARGVFSPPSLLGRAVESFLEDAFEDPAAIDPPDLGDIVLRELFPVLGLAPGKLKLPACLAALAFDIDSDK